MIRFINPPNAYYSLGDVANWLIAEQVLTKKQSQLFSHRCYKYISAELARAYQTKLVFPHLVPIILPVGDYFINWIVWANLLILLPGEARTHRRVNDLNLLLDDPQSSTEYPILFEKLELIIRQSV